MVHPTKNKQFLDALPIFFQKNIHFLIELFATKLYI